jgi:predicted small lipoprotein YifL
LQKEKTKMKRMMLLILVLLFMADMAEDGCLGKGKVYLPYPSGKTTVTASYQLDSTKNDLRHELALPNVTAGPHHGDARPGSPQVPATFQILYCCHLSSSGGIPL